MATRLYLTSRAVGTNLLGPPLGDWTAGDSDRDNRGSHHWTFLAAESKDNGGVASVASEFGTSITKADDQPIIAYRWVTPPLAAPGTLSGTLQLCVGASHGAGTGDEAALAIYAYITTGDTLTQRTVIADNVVSADQMATTRTYTSLNAAAAVSGDYEAGDRICVEVGAVCSPATSPVGDNNFFLNWGTTNSSQTNLADATAGDTALRAAWLEFSDTLSFAAAPAPPGNDACADAVAISSVPYTSPTIDTTTSTDTQRGVYYTYTAAASQRYFASVFGSNYGAKIDIYTGSCGSLVSVISDSKIGWIGTGQACIWWDATQGTTYTIKVTNHYAVTGANSTLSAFNSGGSLTLNVFPYSAPQIDDLFINCQHVASLRSSTAQLVNINPILFYGNTPTGMAVDYTLRELDDLNGGTNSSLRLYLGLFGASPLVEILDLATLNTGIGESEIDYILDAIATGGENLSAIVFDQAGTIYLGWYGDEYSVLGGTPSSEASSAVRYLDGTHADSQPGEPWPVADEWPVVLQSQGSDFVDLAADQDTLYYTSAGTQIYSISVSTGVQGPVYATVPSAPGPRPGLRGLRVVPPGDGSNGILVAAGSVVYWVGPTGNIIQTYNPSPSAQFQDMDKLEITNDGQTFWVSDQFSTYLAQFDITSGTQLQAVNLNFPPGQLCGFAIYGGYRAGTGTNGEGGTPPSPPEPSPYLGLETELPIRWLIRSGVLQ